MSKFYLKNRKTQNALKVRILGMFWLPSGGIDSVHLTEVRL